MLPSLPPEPPETRLETVEELRQLLGNVPRTPTVPEQIPDLDTPPLRPAKRPPIALLCICDDGRDDGEWVRLRADKYVLGRGDGDFRVPHDSMMSNRHAEIVREQHHGRWRWVLHDLQSTNGTFVRVSSAVVGHGQEMMLGARRLRLNLGTGPVGDEEPASNATRGWQTPASNQAAPVLVELTPQGEGRQHLLTATDHWLGRDPRQVDLVLEDPMVSPRHARLHKDAKDRWVLENAGGRNGTWVRVTRAPLETGGMFLLGEQRFIIKVLA
jgi:pSer/pThr/pTyr-binding forkhead associated (FHA) protein